MKNTTWQEHSEDRSFQTILSSPLILLSLNWIGKCQENSKAKSSQKKNKLIPLYYYDRMTRMSKIYQ